MENILAGRYQVVKYLSGGGFGQTFMARDSHLPGHPFCVVKKLKPIVSNRATLQTAKRLFNREAETLYKLGNHDQIPRLLAHFEQDEEFYLVQELIEGQTLDQELIPGNQLSEEYVIGLLKDILQVLSFVHQQHVIHRDIKPANLIRRNKDSKIVLIDFGAVKEVSMSANAQGQTGLTVAIGSPGYMPSEQLSFKPRFSSDIYTVGMVGIQALTGLLPRQLHPDPYTGELSCASFSALAPVSASLAAILDKMVRYDYRQRYQNATEALHALERLRVQVPPLNFETANSELPPTESPPALSADEWSAIETVSGSPPEAEIPCSLNPEFLKRCQQELARCIGPFASFLIDDTLAEQPQIAPQKLIEVLAAEIPNPEQAKQFKEHLTEVARTLIQ